ncbi:hypothetical protein DMUE_4217 [Dictyocoela muelleri]|nr:hypothetical protein DMUE_4217 [Dictyocoela muelleri]
MAQPNGADGEASDENIAQLNGAVGVASDEDIAHQFNSAFRTLSSPSADFRKFCRPFTTFSPELCDEVPIARLFSILVIHCNINYIPLTESRKLNICKKCRRS